MRRHDLRKNTFFALVVVLFVAVTMLTACGKSTDSQQAAPAEDEKTEQTEAKDEGKTPQAGTEDDETEDQVGPAAAYGLEGPIWVLASEKGTYTIGSGEAKEYTATYTYDDHGNVVKYEGEGILEESTYDNEGYVLTDAITYEDEATTNTYEYERDADGRVVKRTGSDGSVTTWEYHPSGRIMSVTTASQGTTLDERTGEETPVEYTTKSYYDETGLATRTESNFGDGEDQLSGFEYELNDEGKPITCTRYTTSGEIQQTLTTTFTYDENGNVSHISMSSENTSEEIDMTWVKVEEPSLYATLRGHLFTY